MEWFWKEDVEKSATQQCQEEKIINFYISLGYSKSLIQWCLSSSLLTREAIIIAIPNNKKKQLGLPLTRLACRGRKKKKYKQTLINYAITTLMWGASREEVDRIANETIYKYIMDCFEEESENENKTCT